MSVFVVTRSNRDHSGNSWQIITIGTLKRLLGVQNLAHMFFFITNTGLKVNSAHVYLELSQLIVVFKSLISCFFLDILWFERDMLIGMNDGGKYWVPCVGPSQSCSLLVEQLKFLYNIDLIKVCLLLYLYGGGAGGEWISN